MEKYPVGRKFLTHFNHDSSTEAMRLFTKSFNTFYNTDIYNSWSLKTIRVKKAMIKTFMMPIIYFNISVL